MDILLDAQKKINQYLDSIGNFKSSLDKKFIKIVNKLNKSSGKIVFTGIGKSGHIAKKISSTMSSLGIASFYLHPLEALHGDLGSLIKDDLMFILSASGESQEIIDIILPLKKIGCNIISITGNKESRIAKMSDLYDVISFGREIDKHNLAPTISSSLLMIYGDILATTLSDLRNFNEEDFALYHPKGQLGLKLLLTVRDVMIKGSDVPVCYTTDYLNDYINQMAEKGLGIVVVINDKKTVEGVFTDGDLRRLLNNHSNIANLNSSHFKKITTNPVTINSNLLAKDVLKILNDNNISSAPVIDSTKNLIGVITLKRLIDIGLSL